MCQHQNADATMSRMSKALEKAGVSKEKADD